MFYHCVTMCRIYFLPKSLQYQWQDLNHLSQDFNSRVLPLCYHGTTMCKSRVFYFLPPGASGRIQTPLLMILIHVFYHCATMCKICFLPYSLFQYQWQYQSLNHLSQDFNLCVLPLCYYGTTMCKVSFVHFISFPVAGGSFQTLCLRLITSCVLPLCYHSTAMSKTAFCHFLLVPVTGFKTLTQDFNSRALPLCYHV